MFGEACPFVRGVGCHGHSRKNSRLGEILTFLTLGEKRVGLCFTSILASDHMDQSNFKTRSLHHLGRPQAPSRIAKGASHRHLLEWVLAAQA